MISVKKKVYLHQSTQASDAVFQVMTEDRAKYTRRISDQNYRQVWLKIWEQVEEEIKNDIS